MISTLKKNITQHVINLPGWQSDRKIIVIESDDWGMIRMASKEAYNWFLKKGYNVDECPVNRNDAIESNEDLELLFEVLSSVRDCYGNPAVITANNIVANPDFKRIRESDFQEYFFEPFTRTLKRYHGRDRVWQLYNEGIDQNLFYPQFHGREHVNVNRWMAELNSGNKVMLDAFERNMTTVHKSGPISCRRDCLDAFGEGYKKKWVSRKEIIQTGLNLFEKLWGYSSSSFIAPCYVWPTEIEKYLHQKNVKYIQGIHVQKLPSPIKNYKIKRKYHYQGQRNDFGQRYLVRNVFFEPALNPNEDSVASALKEIECAFNYKKPAVICSHRFNFIGSINEENRDRNLNQLALLLKKIIKKWPDVEFMTTCTLGKCIENN